MRPPLPLGAWGDPGCHGSFLSQHQDVTGEPPAPFLLIQRRLSPQVLPGAQNWGKHRKPCKHKRVIPEPPGKTPSSVAFAGLGSLSSDPITRFLALSTGCDPVTLGRLETKDVAATAQPPNASKCSESAGLPCSDCEAEPKLRVAGEIPFRSSLFPALHGFCARWKGQGDFERSCRKAGS